MGTSSQIKVLGCSDAVLDKVKSFMSDIGEHIGSLIPMIGLVHSSTILNDDGTCVRTGNHFVLSALAKRDVDEEICLVEGGIEVAIRIPDVEKFYGSYYFDVRGSEIINLNTKMTHSS